VLKVTLPRPSSDVVVRGGEQTALKSAWQRGLDDDSLEAPVKPLTRAEAEAFREAHPTLSPWRVIAAQVAFGALAGLVAWLAAGELAAMSAVYGAAVVAVPGALMARGATSRLSALSPVLSAVSMLGWGFFKLVASVAMLVLASRIVPGLIWPVMLVSMVLCMQTYWFALLWRGRVER
jgi:ATP synthase protein I